MLRQSKDAGGRNPKNIKKGLLFLTAALILATPIAVSSLAIASTYDANRPHVYSVQSLAHPAQPRIQTRLQEVYLRRAGSFQGQSLQTIQSSSSPIPIPISIPVITSTPNPTPQPAKFTYQFTEDISMQVDAPEGYIFNKVIWADFGTPYFDDNFNLTADPNCTTKFETSKILLDIINGKNSVLIKASSAIYGNPCPENQQSLAFSIEAYFPNPYPRPTLTSTPNPTPNNINTNPLTTPTPTPTPQPEVTEQQPTPTPTQIPLDPYEQAQQDDIQLDPSLAAIPVLGNALQGLTDLANLFSNAGSDLSPEARDRSKKVIVASVIAASTGIASAMYKSTTPTPTPTPKGK